MEELIEDHFENPLGGPGMFKVVTTIQSISWSILRHHDASMILDHLGCNFQLLDCMSGLLDSTETKKMDLEKCIHLHAHVDVVAVPENKITPHG